MAPIVTSTEIARPPEDVFRYVTDPSRLAEWQESVVSSRSDESGPPHVGTKVVQTRRMGRREQTMTSEITAISPPSSWAVRGVDGRSGGWWGDRRACRRQRALACDHRAGLRGPRDRQAARAARGPPPSAEADAGQHGDAQGAARKRTWPGRPGLTEGPPGTLSGWTRRRFTGRRRSRRSSGGSGRARGGSSGAQALVTDAGRAGGERTTRVARARVGRSPAGRCSSAGRCSARELPSSSSPPARRSSRRSSPTPTPSPSASGR